METRSLRPIPDHAEFSGKKKEVEVLGELAKIIPESESAPSGPLLGMSSFTWERNSSLHEPSVRSQRGQCPLSKDYTLYFICRTRIETAALVELLKCSDMTDPMKVIANNLPALLSLLGPGRVTPMGFECASAAHLSVRALAPSPGSASAPAPPSGPGLTFLLTSDAHDGRPVYRAYHAGNQFLAYWSNTAKRWFIAASVMSKSLEGKGRAYAVLVEDVPSLELATSHFYIRHTSSQALELKPLVVTSATLPQAGITYIEDTFESLTFFCKRAIVNLHFNTSLMF